MNADEKAKRIQELIGKNCRESVYYDLLNDLGDLKQNYSDYMTSEPINCDYELRRLDDADYDLAAALLTMMLREDHFCNGSFEKRLRLGQVDNVLIKMVELLKQATEPEQGIYIRKEIPPLQLGHIKRMRLISEAGGFGPPPEPDDEIEQHISICSDGRVYLSRYRFGNRMDYKNEKFFQEQFKISPSKANCILSLIGMYFESDYIDIFATDVGMWNLELINEKDEKFHFSGSLCQDLIYRKEYVSRLIREFTDRADLFCFDGDAREKHMVGEGEFIFVDVYFDEYERSYIYICDDKLIQEDDEVVVPFGANNNKLVGCVTDVRVLPRDKAPYPIEKCKKVIERI